MQARLHTLTLTHPHSLTHTHTHTYRGEWWCTSIGFCLIIFLYEELRKLAIRRSPGGGLSITAYSRMQPRARDKVSDILDHDYTRGGHSRIPLVTALAAVKMKSRVKRCLRQLRVNGSTNIFIVIVLIQQAPLHSPSTCLASFPGSCGGAAPFPGSCGGVAPFPGSCGGVAPFPGSCGGVTPFPGSCGGVASFPGSCGGVAPFPGSCGGVAPFPGSCGGVAPFPGSCGGVAPFPGSCGGVAPFPGSCGGVASFPGSLLLCKSLGTRLVCVETYCGLSTTQ